ncbi:endonuclease V [Candidatus Woesearchaeota archaeon]|jgi:deoxyribonuclease (pyrimidine dimer)|nr:endonuclease V [Candidatus Woesearchaeota archaeon]
MVRINIIDPKKLADQHLIAEYNEILMLLGYVRKFPLEKDIPKEYCLGKGHIKFFKNKLLYLKRRHEKLKQEMNKRGFIPTKKINLSEFSRSLRNDWNPYSKDFIIIKKRLREKICLKPNYYRYNGKKKSKKFFLDLLK